MIRFIDEYKDPFGIEPKCRTLKEHLEGGFISSRAYRYVGQTSARALRIFP